MTISGSGQPLLCLHGWMASHESFGELRAALESAQVKIIAPDLPGMGESSLPFVPWNLDDYVAWAEELINELKLDNGALFLGHSFGGRILIKLAAKHEVSMHHLFLCASAGIRHPKHFTRKIKIAIAETGKNVFCIPGLRSLEAIARKVLYKLFRIHDYANVSGVMRETMVKVVNEDLTPLLSSITTPTDLFWGVGDMMTPLKDGKLMNTKIDQSVLHVFDDTKHRVHRDRAIEIGQVICERIT